MSIGGALECSNIQGNDRRDTGRPIHAVHQHNSLGLSPVVDQSQTPLKTGGINLAVPKYEVDFEVF